MTPEKLAEAIALLRAEEQTVRERRYQDKEDDSLYWFRSGCIHGLMTALEVLQRCSK